MDWFAPTMLPVVLLFFGGMNYFGVRRDRPPVSILAMVAGVILIAWGGIYLMDLARWWSGRPREQLTIGYEVFGALLFTFVKMRRWIEVDQPLFQPRLPRMGSRMHGSR